MTKTHRTAVVLIPPHETWPTIQAIRVQHDRHYYRWMPHVTLLYPFYPREGWDAAIEQMVQACRRIRAFQIELATFRTFRHRGNYTIWLAPEPKTSIVELQTALWRAAPECGDTRKHGGGFTPHLSVGQVRGDERMRSLVAALRATWTPIQFVAAEIQLIERNGPDDAFRVGHRIELRINKE